MSLTKMNRRRLLQTVGAAAGAAAVGSSFTGCGGKNKYPEVAMVDDRLLIDLDAHPTLKQLDEGILFQVPNNVENIVVVHTQDGYIASGAMCPHQGCSVRWKKDKKLLVCPCHKAEFEADGTNVRGPGWSKPIPVDEWNKNLTRYSAVLEDNVVVVTPLD